MFSVRTMMTGMLLVAGFQAAALAQPPMRGMQPPPGRRMGPGQRARVANALRTHLMHGITLSDAQKAAVKTLFETSRTQTQAANTQRRIDMLSVEQARLKGDTAALHAARARMLSDGDRVVALRAQMMDGIRGTLTPDQQKQFDLNRSRVAQQVRAARMNRRMGMRRGTSGAQEDVMPPAQGRGRGMMPMRGGGPPPPPPPGV